METKQLRNVVAQLANPNGEAGADIAVKMNDTNAFITARAIEALAPAAGEFIVEIGPGNGALSCDLVKTIGSNGRYLGIEISEDMALVAKKILSEASSAEIDVHSGDYRDIQLDDASLDGLIAVNVLYFIEDLNGLLARIRPWFKPDSRCVFGIRPSRTLENFRFQEFGHQVRSHEEIEDAMRKHGFDEISVIHYDEGEGQLGDITFPNGSIIIKASACS